MAFGFIKKIFSFGKDEAAENPAADQQFPLPAETPEAPASVPAEVPSAPEETLAFPADLPARPAELPVETPDETPTPEAPGEPQPEAPEIPPAEPYLPQNPPAEVPSAPVEPPAELPPELPAELPAEPDIAPEPAPELAAEAPLVSPLVPPVVPETVVSRPPPARVTVAKAVEKKAEATPAEQPVPPPRPTWFQRLRQGLSRSSRELSDSISGVFTKRKLDEDTLQDLEDVLIRADLGMETAIRITDALSSGRYGKDVSDEEVRSVMAAEIEKVLTPVALPLELDLSHKPHVVLVVGVNGTGKTTTIGKLAAKLTAGGLKVTLAAGDTFRAAAIEQLKIWGERTASEVVSSKLGADAAGLAFDAYEKAKANGSDVLVIDTAGRLQNKTELMAELEKIVRVLGKHDPEAPHTVLQTVDATTGQNALNQVEIFRNVAGVNGLVMTKLDGTARGGILVAIAARHKLPVYFIGVGEGIDDLEPFAAKDFAKAIAGVN
jgi:fused signal recognition particle receptor